MDRSHKDQNDIDSAKSVLYFFILSVITMGLPRTFTTSAAIAIFIEVYGAKLLPLSFIITSIVVPMLGFCFLKLEERLSLRTLLVVLLLADAVVLAVVSIGLSSNGPDWLAIVAAVWAEAEWVLTSLVFWGLAERSFDILMAKRYFGRIAAGEPLAAIAGGLLVPLFLLVFSPADLLLASAASVIAGAWMTAWLVRLHASRLAQQDVERETQEDSAVPEAEAVKSRMGEFLKIAFAMVVVADIAYFAVDTAFFLQAETRYPNQAAMAAFIAIANAAVGILSFVGATTTAGWLLTRFGVRTSLLTLPLLLAFAALLILVSGTPGNYPNLVFWLTVCLFLINEGVRSSTYRPAFLTLLQPLPAYRRIRIQALSESVFEQIGAGLAGVILLGLTYFLGVHTFGVVAFLSVALVVWIAQVYLVHRAYLHVLADALGSRQFGQSHINFADPGTRKAIMSKLESERPVEVVTAIELMETAGEPALLERVPALLEHQAPEVRLKALQQLCRMAPDRAFDLLRDRTRRETDTTLRAEIIHQLSLIRHHGATELLSIIARDDEGTERSWAVAGLIRYGAPEDVRFAGEILLRLTTSEVPEDRYNAALILNDIRRQTYQDSLVPLLKDPVHDVKHLAFLAARHMMAPQLRPVLLASLFSPPDRNAAAHALAAMGEEALHDLKNLYERSNIERPVRQIILGIYGSIGGHPAISVLVDVLEGGAVQMRSSAIIGLHAAHYSCPPEDRAKIWNQVRAVIGHIELAYAIRADLAREKAAGALETALAQWISRLEEDLFRLAGFLADQHIMDQAWLQFRTGTSDQIAYAVEMISNNVPVEFRHHLNTLLEPMPFEKRIKWLSGAWRHQRRAAREHLIEIARGPEWATSWMRACALHQIGTTGLAARYSNDISSFRAEGGLVGEIAGWTITRSTEKSAPITTVEKVLFLRAAEIFGALADDDLVDVAASLEVLAFREGQPIIRQREWGTSLYVIISGSVRVLHDDREVARLNDGQVFGELAALDPEPRLATVTAVVDTRVFGLSNEVLEMLISVRPAVGLGIIRMLVQRIRAMAKAA